MSLILAKTSGLIWFESCLLWLRPGDFSRVAVAVGGVAVISVVVSVVAVEEKNEECGGGAELLSEKRDVCMLVLVLVMLLPLLWRKNSGPR